MNSLTAPLDASLGFNLHRVALLFRRELLAALEPWNLVAEQWQVLIALSASPKSRSQQDLARLTLTDKHSLSRMLERMERAGWIERRKADHDARASRVVLTDRAKTELPAMSAAVDARFHRVHALVSSTRRQQLLEILLELRGKMEVSR